MDDPHELAEWHRLVGEMTEVVEPFDDGIALIFDQNARSYLNVTRYPQRYTIALQRYTLASQRYTIAPS